MHLNTEKFVQNSEAATQNENLQARLRVLSSFTLKRDAAFAELSDGEALRDRARAIKQEAIANLDLYLLQLEESIHRLGGKVHWARNGEEARLDHSRPCSRTASEASGQKQIDGYRRD